jgi:peptidyl-tRNA hydrolase, PTH1 family
MKLIVGLGNPGSRYANTRHNIGFMVLDELARRWNLSFRSKDNAELIEQRLDNGKRWLQKPQTYMNLSGDAVAPLWRFQKLSLAELLVVHDDLDLPFGRLRLRLGGSAGGQRGVRDIMDKIGGDGFLRLKIGISRPPPGFEVIDWVLRPFMPEEQELLDKVISASADAIEQMLRQGLARAQSHINQTDLRPKPAPVKPVSEDVAAEPSTIPPENQPDQ